MRSAREVHVVMRRCKARGRVLTTNRLWYITFWSLVSLMQRLRTGILLSGFTVYGPTASDERPPRLGPQTLLCRTSG